MKYRVLHQQEPEEKKPIQFTSFDATRGKEALNEQDSPSVSTGGMGSTSRFGGFCCQPILIDVGMMFFYQFAGYNVVTSYAGSILQRDEDALRNATQNPEVE